MRDRTVDIVIIRQLVCQVNLLHMCTDFRSKFNTNVVYICSVASTLQSAHKSSMVCTCKYT